MPGADGDGVQFWAVGVIAAAASGAGYLLTKLIPYWQRRQDRENKLRRDAYEAARVAHEGQIRQLQAQGERCGAALDELRGVVERLQVLDADRREENAELRLTTRWLYDQLCRFHAAMLAAKLDPGPLPERPVLRERHDPREAEFMARQARQSAALVAEAKKDVEASRPTPPPPPLP